MTSYVTAGYDSTMIARQDTATSYVRIRYRTSRRVLPSGLLTSTQAGVSNRTKDMGTPDPERVERERDGSYLAGENMRAS